MKRNTAIILTCVLALLVTSCPGGIGGKKLVTINGNAITEEDLDFLSTVNPRLKSQLATEFGKKKILDNLVEQELLYQASTKAGIHRDPDVQAKVDLYRKVIISQEYMDKKLTETAEKYYNEHKSEFEKLAMGHIMIKFKKEGDKESKVKRTEKEALAEATKIKESLDKGEDFAELAKKSSEDPITQKRGGDLGMVSKEEPRLVRRGFAPLLEKAFTMKVGEVAGPVKTESGYHLITLTKGVELQTIDQVKQAILFKIRADARNKILADLKGNATIEYMLAEKKEEPTKKEAPAKAEKIEEVKKTGAEKKIEEPKEVEKKAEVEKKTGEPKEVKASAKPEQPKKAK